LTHADAVTVASRALETIAWSLGVPRNRVSYVPNGVNRLPTGDASRAELRAKLELGDAPTILLYTRFFEFSMERLGAILSQILRVKPQARLLVVGQGLKGEDAQFLRMADAQGWRANVVHAGWVDFARLGDTLRAADVAIYPFDDTLVNRTKAIVKLMDLLAAGIPVVADTVGQIREYITPDKTGILVEPGDVNGFARSVLELLDDAAKRERLGSCAAQTMARDYDWDRLAERVEALYAGHAKSLSSSSSVGT
jgi:glycosyltransferase involved in cell wall biosynthesis